MIKKMQEAKDKLPKLKGQTAIQKARAIGNWEVMMANYFEALREYEFTEEYYKRMAEMESEFQDQEKEEMRTDITTETRKKLITEMAGETESLSSWMRPESMDIGVISSDDEDLPELP